MIRAFDKTTKGKHPAIKKGVAEGMMRGVSKELKDLYMSLIDLL
jgi:hypothetical protein